ncbi:nucleotidyl transferase AbiEii/AbiGii toxin family protein [Providencia alcalifaciens]|uniref:nucleotidyl transferase AbiEii/AbiGii toxin family protein n=1 Tax=Providencia alcalifaciens TaxID=126385 RepID=UPI0018A6E73B|nr:nucleotidyl transferase AbiEii/AbiGii toxin family protein [Providencia alcalifaciens]
MPHVGTLDIDLDLDSTALGDGEYATLVESLQSHGYEQREGVTRAFQLIRTVPGTIDSPDIDIIIDFLRPKDRNIIKNNPPLVDKFAVQRADGAELALKYYEVISISGVMPEGGKNRIEIAVCSIPALLAMKGYALNGRHKQKDSYDIYYCIRNYEDGPEALAQACQPVLAEKSGLIGYQYIEQKFDSVDAYGPTSVRKFVEETDILGEKTPEQWQQDAFGQVDLWLRALKLRS